MSSDVPRFQRSGDKSCMILRDSLGELMALSKGFSLDAKVLIRA